MTHFKCGSCGNEADAEAAPECCGAPMQEAAAEQPAEAPQEAPAEAPAEDSAEEPKQE